MQHNDIPVSLYVHIPWCIKKCPYCDFNSFENKVAIYPFAEYFNKLKQDFIQSKYLLNDRKIISIFIGGGTPSLADPSYYYDFINFLDQNYGLSKDIEITMELNPGTAEYFNINDYYLAGINRISIGAQSFNDQHLHSLGRIHNTKNIIEVANKLQNKNFNIDLMHNLPKQTLVEAMNDLNAAIALNPPHISWYQLTIEPNTYFYKHRPVTPNDDLSFEILNQGLDLLEKNGYKRYEISAFGKNYFCKHNLNYWEFGDYLGIGVGASSKISYWINNKLEVIRFNKPKSPTKYLEANDFMNQFDIIEDEQLQFEFMLNAARLIDGFNLDIFTNRTGLDLSKIQTQLNKGLKKELIYIQNNHIYPTKLGILFNNELQEIFLK